MNNNQFAVLRFRSDSVQAVLRPTLEEVVKAPTKALAQRIADVEQRKHPAYSYFVGPPLALVPPLDVIQVERPCNCDACQQGDGH